MKAPRIILATEIESHLAVWLQQIHADPEQTVDRRYFLGAGMVRIDPTTIRVRVPTTSGGFMLYRIKVSEENG